MLTSPTIVQSETDGELRHREVAVILLSMAALLVFFQAYLVAPLIPALCVEFHRSQQFIGLAVPAYLIPYGIATLVYGPLSDRVGRHPVLLVTIGALGIAIAGASTARSASAFIIWRCAAGIASGGIIPISLALLGDLFPYRALGRPLGWVFGAIAGGMALGATLGAFFYPVLGWRTPLLVVAAANCLVFLLVFRYRATLFTPASPSIHPWLAAFSGYAALLKLRRSQRTYGYVLLNGMFHAGIFSWLGVYFATRYHFGEREIGLSLLGYGIPGMLLGPVIGRGADRLGRRLLIPIGIILAAICALALALPLPHLVATLAVVLLSLGYDLTHPLLAGIVTALDHRRRGQALGLNAFVLFTGFGLGSLLFQKLLSINFATALAVFGVMQLLAGLLSIRVFRDENSHRASGEE